MQASTGVATLVAEVVAAYRGEGDAAYDRFLDICDRLGRLDAGAAVTASFALMASGDSEERAAGVDLATRLAGRAGTGAAARVAERVISLLDDPDAAVVETAVYGLGHLDDPPAVEPLLALVDHPSADIRQAVASELPTETGDERAVAALLTLTADPAADVRDWACFTLGVQREDDTPAIRAALAARLNDPHDSTRGEAAKGLALRGDERGLAALLGRLRRDEVVVMDIDAAGETGDPRFHAALCDIASWWPPDDPERRVLDTALRRCAPRH